MTTEIDAFEKEHYRRLLNELNILVKHKAEKAAKMAEKEVKVIELDKNPKSYVQNKANNCLENSIREPLDYKLFLMFAVGHLFFMLLEMNNSLFEATAKTWFGDLGDFVSFRCIIHDLRNNIPINPSRVSEFNDKNIGNLILKVAPIIKPLDQVLCDNIDYNEKTRILKTADYNTLFDYYKGYGFSDEDIASIIIILEIRGMIKGWGRKDTSMLATKMKPEAFRYIAMLDSY